MSRTTAGEAMEFEWNGNLSWDAYLTIAADKTAPLLTAPIQGIAVMIGDYQAEAIISRYFRDLGEAYQIANDISNYNGSDGAKLIAGDLARRAPNAVTLSFIDGLNTDDKARFNDWYHSGDTDDLALWQARILDSDAMKAASNRMFATLDRATHHASDLSAEISEVVTPVHGLIMRACSTASKNGAA
jgi:geranylgeranyl pyrophosphate synthase